MTLRCPAKVKPWSWSQQCLGENEAAHGVATPLGRGGARLPVRATHVHGHVRTVTAPRAHVSEVYTLSARLTELRPEGWGGDGIRIIVVMETRADPVTDVPVREPQEAEAENGDRRKLRRNGCRFPSATPVSPHGDRSHCCPLHGLRGHHS
uniref:Uncharacterized protein n=1 Tax=Myotis myotis TaxID=51298 RepID=A0A7J7Z644_MYOMY|nr:hypothetical protein mMyoMyo1_010815 [Myotis myotis]